MGLTLPPQKRNCKIFGLYVLQAGIRFYCKFSNFSLYYVKLILISRFGFNDLRIINVRNGDDYKRSPVIGRNPSPCGKFLATGLPTTHFNYD